MSFLGIELHNFCDSLSIGLSMSYDSGYGFGGLAELTQVVFVFFLKKYIFSALLG
jgi:hypothetical protein